MPRSSRAFSGSHLGNRCIRLAVFAVVLGTASSALADPNYVFTPINGVPTGINDSRQVVGYQLTGADFLLNPDGTIQTFDVPGGTVAVVPSYTFYGWPGVGLGINNLGQIIGNGQQGAFLRSPDGSIRWLSLPNDTLLTGINDSDQVTGFAFLSSSPCGNYTCGVVGDLSGSLTFFGFSGETYALGINNSGQVVGNRVQGGATSFLRNADGTIIGSLGLGYNEFYMNSAFGINNEGEIVGGVFCDDLSISEPGCAADSEMNNGFIRDPDGSLTFIDYPGAQHTTLTGINDEGDIIGVYSNADGTSGGFLAAPVPEPTALLLVATILILFVALGRRGKSRSQARTSPRLNPARNGSRQRLLQQGAYRYSPSLPALFSLNRLPSRMYRRTICTLRWPV